MPRLVQMVWRECATAVLQLPVGRADRGHVELHVRLLGRAATFFEVAGQARSGHVFPACPATQTARDDVVEGQIMSRPAILTFELVAQKQVEARKSRIFRRLHILAERYDRRDSHVDAGAVYVPVIVRDDIDLVEEHRLDRGLPRPQAQRIIAKRRIIGIEHQRRTIFRVPRTARCLESSGV